MLCLGASLIAFALAQGLAFVCRGAALTVALLCLLQCAVRCHIDRGKELHVGGKLGIERRARVRLCFAMCVRACVC